MRYFLFPLIFLLTHGIHAQNVRNPDAAFRLTESIPESSERSVDSLAGYILKHYASSQERIHAIYTWVAGNISYDEDQAIPFQPDESPEALIRTTFKSRKAVCRGYSELFKALCDRSGIRSYTVPGFTRQEGRIVNDSHVWVAAPIGGKWYLFDPTWGSGYMSGRKYMKRISYDYFMMEPERAIRTHMPFDPLWQCLEHPVTVKEFYQNLTSGDLSSPGFSYADSIDAWEKQTETERYIASLRRIETNGIFNKMIYEYAEYLYKTLEADDINRKNAERNLVIARFNEAVEEFNLAAKSYNAFVRKWDRTERSAKRDDAARSMADSCGDHILKCREILRGLETDDSEIISNANKLFRQTVDLEKQMIK